MKAIYIATKLNPKPNPKLKSKPNPKPNPKSKPKTKPKTKAQNQAQTKSNPKPNDPKSNLSFSGVNLGDKRNHFLLGRNHARDFLVLRELQPGDSFKALLQMRLYSSGILGLREDF